MDRVRCEGGRAVRKRGLVVEVLGKEAVVLTPQGEFIRSRRPQAAAIGDEIDVVALAGRSTAWYGRWAVAACLLLA
jgi:hypothetical protein